MHYECIALPTELLRPGPARDYRQAVLCCKGANRLRVVRSLACVQPTAEPAAAAAGGGSASSSGSG